MIFDPMVRSAQTTHLVKISTISKQTKTSIHLSLVTLEFHQVCPIWFFEPMAHSVQIVHLYSTNTKNVYKWTEMRFHMTHLPRSSIGYIQDDFPSLWNIRHKPRNYLASRLALSPNELKQASTWASSPRSIVGCVQNDFPACGTFGANRAPILHRH
jgi:hypothetical protein